MLELHIPKYEELWFRSKMLADPETMAYNRAWGGTIDWPESRWADWYSFWVEHPEGRRFYRYLKADGEFAGEIAYHFDDDYGVYLADVIIFAPFRGRGHGRRGLELLCEAAKENGVDVLYDNIALDNPAIGMFLKAGFIEDRRTEEFIFLKKKLSL